MSTTVPANCNQILNLLHPWTPLLNNSFTDTNHLYHLCKAEQYDFKWLLIQNWGTTWSLHYTVRLLQNIFSKLCHLNYVSAGKFHSCLSYLNITWNETYHIKKLSHTTFSTACSWRCGHSLKFAHHYSNTYTVVWFIK